MTENMIQTGWFSLLSRNINKKKPTQISQVRNMSRGVWGFF